MSKEVANDTIKTISMVGEFNLIRELFMPLQRQTGSSPDPVNGDDAAVVTVPRTQQLLVTTDTLVEGVHFQSDTDPYLLGQKALRVNLSDIAAMGGNPRWYQLSISMPPSVSYHWVSEVARGLKEAGETFNVSLVGGDTVSTRGCISLTITMLGLVGQGRAVLRKGAMAGDKLYVSGTVGDAALGWSQRRGVLQVLEGEDISHLQRRLDLPEPRIALGLALQDAALMRAAIDISDGLVADLEHIAQASGVGAVIHAEKLPLSPAAQRVVHRLGGVTVSEIGKLVFCGGEDYELLFAAAPACHEQIMEISQQVGVPITEIGEFTAEVGQVAVLYQGQTVRLKRAGWTHF
ncbi:MAG: thiamine-phosphate kinase [Magnetococcales bacterium]|nr:thiamine-phosphate kinase [Magnetococcales bacterium]NGZ26665.1 thiamine-phosphate kinase [Magnetococcales bacterium]